MKHTSYWILLLAIAAVSCSSNEKPTDFDYGNVVDHKYQNSFFGVEMNVSPDWIIQNKEQTENLKKTGEEMVTGDNSRLKKALKASDINSAYLLTVFQYEVGSPVDFNPSIMIIVENIKRAPGIKMGSDYLFQTRKFMLQAETKYDKIDSVFSKKVINGTDFYTMNGEINYSQINVTQTYFSTILKQFSFNVIISYANENQKVELLKMVNSIKFK